MVTEDMIEAAWTREQDPVAQLVVIRSDADPDPIRATDWPDGLTSNGQAFPYYPFDLAWIGASREAPFGDARLTIDNVDERIEAACDAAYDPPELDLMLVRVEAPDVVEKAVLGARIPSIEADASRVQAVVRARDFGQEPACAFNYTPATVPGLF